MNGLDARDLHRLRPVGHDVVGLNDADIADALGVEHFDRLIDQLDFRHNECQAIAFAACAFNDRRRH